MAFNGFPTSEKLLLVRKLLEERAKGSLFGRLFLNVNYVDDTTLRRDNSNHCREPLRASRKRCL